jgi:hypothetical protein
MATFDDLENEVRKLRKKIRGLGRNAASAKSAAVNERVSTEHDKQCQRGSKCLKTAIGTTQALSE